MSPGLTVAFVDVPSVVISVLAGAAVASLLVPGRVGRVGALEAALVSGAVLLVLHADWFNRPSSSTLRPSDLWRPTLVGKRLPAAALLALAGNAVLTGSRELTLTAAIAMVAPVALLTPVARRWGLRLVAPPVARILIVGSGDVADRVTRRLRRCADIVVVGQVDDHPRNPDDVLGSLAELHTACAEHAVDQVVVAFSRSPAPATIASLRRLAGVVPITVVPRLFELHSWRSHIEELHGIPLVHIAPPQRGRTAQAGKRTLDLCVAVLALSVLALPGIVLAGLIKLDSPGPVFFRQDRTGRDGRVFRIFKFRTMAPGSEAQRAGLLQANQADGPLFKLHTDPRVTRLGAVLRRTSIDELPQLLNVLTGDMSLVGPRPLPVEESARLDGAALTRFDVLPGITGLWQISGRSDLDYADLQHLDAVYVNSWSLRWDLRILLATPGSVLARRGAY